MNTTYLLMPAAVVCAIAIGCAQPSRPNYPEQTHFFGPETNFFGPTFRAQSEPASPTEVEQLYGRKVASLPRLGVILILLWNNAADGPLSLERRSVVLTLPDGRTLHPLEPSEIISWAASAGVRDRNEIYGQYRPDIMSEIDSGTFFIRQGHPRGLDFVFRFPETVKPGTFTVDYVVQNSGGDRVHVKTKVPLAMSL